mmetsp:Transcript_34720/g.109081  ORF Transcript_34720/g.109081 Transcript_34720/m.109081 type:complete len:223 (-) Transcript_34720:1167-1835(-)
MRKVKLLEPLHELAQPAQRPRDEPAQAHGNDDGERDGRRVEHCTQDCGLLCDVVQLLFCLADLPVDGERLLSLPVVHGAGGHRHNLQPHAETKPHRLGANFEAVCVPVDARIKRIARLQGRALRQGRLAERKIAHAAAYQLRVRPVAVLLQDRAGRGSYDAGPRVDSQNFLIREEVPLVGTGDQQSALNASAQADDEDRSGILGHRDLPLVALALLQPLVSV